MGGDRIPKLGDLAGCLEVLQDLTLKGVSRLVPFLLFCFWAQDKWLDSGTCSHQDKLTQVPKKQGHGLEVPKLLAQNKLFLVIKWIHSDILSQNLY